MHQKGIVLCALGKVLFGHIGKRDKRTVTNGPTSVIHTCFTISQINLINLIKTKQQTIDTIMNTGYLALKCGCLPLSVKLKLESKSAGWNESGNRYLGHSSVNC